MKEEPFDNWKLFWNIFFAIIVVFAFLSPASAGVNWGMSHAVKSVSGNLREKEGQDAERLLSITSNSFIDPANDFKTPPDGASSSGVYPYSPIDIRSFQFANDNEFLYLKITFAADLPSKAVEIGGEQINKINVNISINTGSEKVLSFMLRPGNQYASVYFHADPTGFGEEGYSRKGYGSLVKGGAGYNAIILKYRLSDINVPANSTVTLSVWAEAESMHWHHYSFDAFPESGYITCTTR